MPKPATTSEDFIDWLLDAYRDSFKRKDRPKLDAWFEKTAGDLQDSQRSLALRRLVKLEIELRRRDGESVEMEEYLEQFSDVLDDDFRDVAAIPPPSAAEQRPLLPSRYELLEPIGRGGLGVVWRVRDRNLDRPLAVKVLRSEIQLDPDTNRRLSDEATIMGSLQHPGIPPVVEQGELVHGVNFFSMKLVEGRDLSALFRQRKNLEEGRVDFVENLTQVAEAIGYAHEQGILHCDLKPHNVMVGAFGEVQIMDWGLARRFRAVQTATRPNDNDFAASQEVASDAARVPATDSVLFRRRTQSDTARAEHDVTAPDGMGDSATRTGQVMGSPAYMAPEQARGQRDQTDPRTDVFALAGILYELLTGKPPASGSTRESTLEAARRGRPVDVRSLNSKAPLDLVAICMKGLSEKPADRYRTAADFAADLRAWLRGMPVQARQASPWDRVNKWIRRYPSTAALVVVSSIALAGFTALGVGGWAYQQLDQAHQEIVVEKNKVDGLNLELETEKQRVVAAFRAETKARNEAEDQRDAANRANAASRVSLNRALDAEALTQRILYDGDMARANDAIRNGDTVFARRILENYEQGEPSKLRGMEWNYLNDRATSVALELETSNASDAMFIDGDQTLLVARGTMLERYNAGTGELIDQQQPFGLQLRIQKLREHPGDPDKFVMVCRTAVYLLDASDYALEFVMGARFVTGIAMSADGTYLAILDKQDDGLVIRLHSFRTGKERTIRPELEGYYLEGLCFDRDNHLLAGCENGQVLTIDLESAEVESRRKVSDNQVRALVLSRGDSQLTFVDYANAYHYSYPALIAKRMEPVSENGFQIFPPIMASPNGNLVAYSIGTCARVLEGDRTFSLGGHRQDVTSIHFSSDAARVVTTSRDGMTRVWDLRSQFGYDSIALEEGNVGGYGAGMSADGRYSLVGTRDKDFKVVDTITGKTLRTLSVDRLIPQGEDRSFPIKANFHPKGQYASFVTMSNRVDRYWIWKTGIGLKEPASDELRELEISEANSLSGGLERIQFSRDGRYVVTSQLASAVPVGARREYRQVLRVTRQSLDDVNDRTETDIPFDGQVSIATRSDGEELTVVSWKTIRFAGQARLLSNIRCFDLSTGRQTREVDRTGAIEILDPSSDVVLASYVDENRVLIRGKDLELWDLESGELVAHSFRDGAWGNEIQSLVALPEQGRLLIGARGQCEIWDLGLLQPLATVTTPRLYTGRFNSMAWNPERGLVASGGGASVEVWPSLKPLRNGDLDQE